MNIKEKLIAVNMRQLKWNRKRILAWVLAVVLCGAACGPKTEEPEVPTQEEYVEPTFVGERVAALPAGQWQEEAAFPDRKGYVDDTLAGGLYGVVIGHCFFGESMFSDAENGSKLALVRLAEWLSEQDFQMIDCQFHTDHLESMGGVRVSYEEYMRLLQKGQIPLLK